MIGAPQVVSLASRFTSIVNVLLLAPLLTAPVYAQPAAVTLWLVFRCSMRSGQASVRECM